MQQNIPEFLIQMLEKQYGAEITKQIVNGYNVNRLTSFRINTLKSNSNEIEKILKEEKIDFEKIEFLNEAYIVKNVNEFDLQKLEIYKEGKIYLQSLSSMLPPIILDPKPSNDILDMAAAPGGKTTQIAALTNNQAHITACEMNPIRAERLKYNLEKQGASSVYCMIKDSRTIDDFFSFDQILLDAPCSGSGTINSNDENLSKYFTQKLVEKSVKLQSTLLKKAVKILKPGCEMVYSTCSILQEENEGIIQSILKNGDVEIVPIKNELVKELPLLPTKIDGTLCIMPNELFEGFFVAKLKKK